MDNYKILIAPLYGASRGGKLCYYYNENEDKLTCCDALLSAEASCKYVLANHKIDEIITFGSESTYDSGDETRSVMLKDGTSFYTTDIKEMSTYSLFRYRMAEYLDEINAELQDIMEMLDENQTNAMTAFLNNYFRSFNQDGTKKFNRFFYHILKDNALREDMEKQMAETIVDFEENRQKYTVWAYQYLYSQSKDSFKLELLESNMNLKIRFLPMGKDGSDVIAAFVQKFTSLMKDINDSEGTETVEVYICMHGENVSDLFVLMNLINLIRNLPDSNIRIAKIISTKRNPDGIVSEIDDGTDEMAVSDLVSGVRAFHKYGKVDMLLEYWASTGIHNPDVERLLYAMRNIDTGISLCDINDIERGIDSLRKIFNEKTSLEGVSSFAEVFFGFIAQSIRQDYGKLLKTDKIEFIDLVKWAYRKGFWQQTLTLIESRAPRDFVSRGFFYYSNSPACSQTVIPLFARIYYDLKPFEKYKMDDISHYYVKFYNRYRLPRMNDPRAFQMEYTRARISELNANDAETIKAHTICPDTEALQNLLFAYYYLCDVRNATNHAIEGFGGFSSIMNDSDMGERMNTIMQAVEYFIHCYDIVDDLVTKSGTPADVDIIPNVDIVEFSRSFKPHYDNRFRNDEQKDDNKEEKKE